MDDAAQCACSAASAVQPTVDAPSAIVVCLFDPLKQNYELRRTTTPARSDQSGVFEFGVSE